MHFYYNSTISQSLSQIKNISLFWLFTQLLLIKSNFTGEQLTKRNILQLTREESSIDVRILAFYSYIKSKDMRVC